MFYAKLILTAALLTASFDCASTKYTAPIENPIADSPPKISANLREIPADFIVTLERTACYGRCPVYKLTIKADGSVIFEGKKHTKINGKTEAKIDETKLNQLIGAIENSDYFKFGDKYNVETCSSATDLPTAFTSVQINGKTKSVEHDLGCIKLYDGTDISVLSKLTELEDKIDEIAATKQWIGE